MAIGDNDDWESSALKFADAQLLLLDFGGFAGLQHFEERLEGLAGAAETPRLRANGPFELVDEINHLQLCRKSLRLHSLRRLAH